MVCILKDFHVFNCFIMLVCLVVKNVHFMIVFCFCFGCSKSDI